MKIEEKIKSKILLSNNNMRLDFFLKYALYDNDGYYYKKKPLGSKSDFITSPEISQMFGEIIGSYLYYFWKVKINSKFNLIELGPGTGSLFNDITKSVSNYPDFLNNADISFIEINKELIKLQKQTINYEIFKNLNWREEVEFKSKLPSIIYSNEFFDCFPVRQFIYKEEWFEKYVNYNLEEQKFYLEEVVVNNQELIKKLDESKENKILEISFERNKYFERICRFLKDNGGIFFTIDYGYIEKPRNYTLQAIQNHNFSNLFENIGEKDISSHVDFEHFINIAKDNKLKIEEYCTQGEFLLKYGILDRVKKLSKPDNAKDIKVELNRLIDQKEMGDLFKCLVISNL